VFSAIGVACGQFEVGGLVTGNQATRVRNGTQNVRCEATLTGRGIGHTLVSNAMPWAIRRIVLRHDRFRPMAAGRDNVTDEKATKEMKTRVMEGR
jgi:hypothetical protein